MNQKDEELSKMRLEIGTYANKINSLSDELDRIERAQRAQVVTQTVKYVERESQETIVLRSQVDQLNLTNASLTTKIAEVNQDISNRNEQIKDLERRISILEDTNSNLEKELRIAIDSRKAASRVTYVQDEGLKETVMILKAELNEIRSFNQLIRQENDELYSQLEQARTHQHHCHHNKHVCKGRSRSKSPISKKIVERTYHPTHSEVTFYQPTL